MTQLSTEKPMTDEEYFIVMAKMCDIHLHVKLNQNGIWYDAFNMLSPNAVEIASYPKYSQALFHATVEFLERNPDRWGFLSDPVIAFASKMYPADVIELLEAENIPNEEFHDRAEQQSLIYRLIKVVHGCE